MMKEQMKKKIVGVVIACLVMAGPLSMVSNAQKPHGKQNNGMKEIVVERILPIKAEIEAKKQEIKAIKVQMKETIKSKYSYEEMEKLHKLGEEIKGQYKDVRVIPVEKILTRKINIKFDTPPVIKQGRTLIPVRAITEGFGAQVDWNAEERIVTITKGEVVIQFTLNDGKVTVNGIETVIDVPAQLMNNRTIVPLRFIVEQLGLKINYDEETDTIEIDDEAEGDDEEEEAEDDQDEETDGDTESSETETVEADEDEESSDD